MSLRELRKNSDAASDATSLSLRRRGPVLALEIGDTLGPALHAALCGLPGAGKTTLCRALLQTAKHGIQIKHISFDGFLRDHSSNFTKWDDEAAASWKACREAAVSELRASLTGYKLSSIREPLLLLLDDNMYYRSMRLECAQLARQHKAAFIIIYMPCPLEDAAARNAQRAEADQVSQDVLSRMAARLEPPCPSKHAWEGNTVTVPAKELPSPDDLDGQAWAGVWEAILGAWGPPLPEADPSKQRGPPTAASATVGHDVDLRSRRMVAAAIGKVGPREGRAAAAGRLNAARRELLARLHKDEGWRDPAQQLGDFEQMCTNVAHLYM